MVTRENLVALLASYRFSDEESDRICQLDDEEVLALANLIWGKFPEWIGDAQASEGDLMREAGFRAGYSSGYDDGFEQGLEEGYAKGSDEGLRVGRRAAY